MKAWVVSDMHVNNSELSRPVLEIPDADICICAGDISGIVEMSMQFLLRNVSPHMPVVAVLGNHDCYGCTIEASLKTAKRMTKGSNVTVLENETFFFGKTRIIGATLWTDFEVEHGVENELPLPERKAHAINVCKRYMMDFHAIYRSDWPQRGMLVSSLPRNWLSVMRKVAHSSPVNWTIISMAVLWSCLTMRR